MWRIRKTQWIRFCSTRGGQKREGMSIWKPAAFTLLVGSSTYTVSICVYEMKRKSFLKRQQSNEEHYSSQYKREENVVSKTLKQIKQWWQHQFRYHEKFYFAIFSLNTCVFVAWNINAAMMYAWRFKRLHPLLTRHFASSPAHGSTSSLLLSAFSHKEVWHYLINMYVMWTFMPPFISLVGREGSWPYYLTAATFASMIGHYHNLFRGLHFVSSVGASGALYAVASLVVLHHPEASLRLVFFPFIPIPASTGLTCIVALDVIGLLRGWKKFGHAAHLGGAAFGMFYYYYGRELYHKIKPKVIRVFNYFT